MRLCDHVALVLMQVLGKLSWSSHYARLGIRMALYCSGAVTPVRFGSSLSRDKFGYYIYSFVRKICTYGWIWIRL